MDRGPQRQGLGWVSLVGLVHAETADREVELRKDREGGQQVRLFDFDGLRVFQRVGAVRLRYAERPQVWIQQVEHWAHRELAGEQVGSRQNPWGR